MAAMSNRTRLTPGKPSPKSRPTYARSFIREWREHRDLSLDRLVERLTDPITGEAILTKTSLSRVERGKQPYTQQTLEAIAAALSCSPADLLMRDPSIKSAPWSVWDTVQRLDPRRQEELRAVVEALAKTGTDG